MNLPTILVVDDEIGVLQSMRFALDRDFGVLTATCATEAIELLRSKTVDVVLLDVLMPDHDGIETLEVIRSEWPTLPVLMMSALETRRESAKSKGANGWLVKPPDLEDLRSEIRSLVNEKQL